MKPNFALNLSAEGASLLYRSGNGWVRVGNVPFDDSDMARALKALKTRAARLPGDLTCKLVIPNDQIKYLSIEAENDPEASVRAALEGATPYAVEELEYDWTAADGVIQVAAVALETLAEAEAFAAEHGFDAVSFAAIPVKDAFRGEPFFGVTRRAGEILPHGTIVERDDTAIRITGDAEIPPQPMPKAPEAKPEPAAPPADAPVASAAAEAVASAPPAPKQPAAKAEATAKPAPDKKPDTPKPAPESQPAKPATPAPEKPKAAAPKVAPPTSAALSAPPVKGAAPLGPVPRPRAPAKDDEPSKPAPVAAFSSIRASRDGDAVRATPPLAGDARAKNTNGTDTAPPLPSPASDDVADPARLAELAASLHPDPSERLNRDAADAARTTEAPTEKPGLLSRKTKAASKSAPRPTREDEKQRMTVFGARKSPVRGKPRFLGLILTALLLLFLVGVAAWASVFLEDGLSRFFGRGDDIKLADVPAEDEAEPGAEIDAPAIEPLPEIAALPGGSDRPEVVALPDLPAPLAPDEALARYAATGIWQMAPTSPEIPVAGAPLSDIYEVSLDPGLGLGDPASMPRRAPDARDVRPETPVDPPPAGTRFDFDDRGFVRATPGGVVTPQGVRVFAGSPPMTPPQNMPQTVTVTATPETAEPDLAPGTTFTGDPALAGTRPRVRPDSIMAATPPTPAEAAPETREDGQNTVTGAGDDVQTAEATAADAALAALRPRLRPAQIAALAATLQSAQTAAAAPLVDGASLNRALAAATAADTDPEEEADEDSFENATAQAVTASLTPLRRPGDFEKIIKRTQQSAAAQPVPAAQRLQPSIPSSASVSQQATLKDAINLRQVNLIGVYGSTASRRALVRLGNGRYQKVRIGDALDGGQVAAIGDSELRYIKRGKNVVLRIPQS
ncbi:hypothetical protein [Roseovarius dicentrarchi]|uniref:hypothetical protein n=1 Tax=Roseovarius dicentrarchi TaxID=2250573 RepID=UPI000DE9B342|nr:hypothetical protein [Roseovarius dicentrarchi]